MRSPRWLEFVEAEVMGQRQPALVVDHNRRIVLSNAEYRRRFSPGRDPRGRHCWEVTHAGARSCSRIRACCPALQTMAVALPRREMHAHFSVNGPAYQEVLCVPVADDTGRVHGVVQYLLDLDEVLFFGAEDDPNRLVGWSSAFSRMMSLSYRVAREKTIALLVGESGTQKRHVAAAIHRISGRQGPLITIDCGAVSAERFPFELAQQAGTGTVVGTLLLSRMDRAPLDLQAALLHMLKTGVAGPSSPVHVKVRVLCATERDLGRLVRQGAFFEHLYYRVNVFPIRVPPLRERMDDLEPLVEHYLRLIDRDQSVTLTAQAWARLRDYDYPGNLAQLRAILERACVVSGPGSSIGPEHIEFGPGLGN